MSKLPKISIITPSYNQGQFLEETIKSVLSQEGDFYIDYIIMDGGSTDNTVDIIKKYDRLLKEEKWSIKCKGIDYCWVSEKDKGQSNAINKGFKQAKGEIVNWLCSDDYYVTSMCLDKVIAYFKKNPETEIVYGGTIAIDDEKNELWRHNPPEVSLYSFLYREEGVPQPSVFYYKYLLERFGYLNENLNFWMDFDLFIRFLLAGCKFHRINIPLSVQTYHYTSKSWGPDCETQRISEDKELKKHYFEKVNVTEHYEYLKRYQNEMADQVKVLNKELKIIQSIKNWRIWRITILRKLVKIIARVVFRVKINSLLGSL